MVKATPAESSARPGSKVGLKVEVRRPGGEEAASGADVTVVVVDDALLALSGFKMPDPADIFHQQVFHPSLLPQHGVSDMVLAQEVLTEEELQGIQEDLEHELMGGNTWGADNGMVMDQMFSGAQEGGWGAPMMAMSMSPSAAAPMAKMSLMSSEAAPRMRKKMAGGRGSSLQGPGRGLVGDRGGAGAAGPAIALRSNFDAIALFKTNLSRAWPTQISHSRTA